MVASRRSFRVAEQVREVIGKTLQEASDPRFELLTITSVIVSSDLKSAKIYWINSSDKFKVDDILKALNKGASFFRRHISMVLKLRAAPQIRFYFDDTTKTMLEVHELLNRIKTDEEE